jgi:ketosteroid isomerase-like protein
MLEKKKS